MDLDFRRGKCWWFSWPGLLLGFALPLWLLFGCASRENQAPSIPKKLPEHIEVTYSWVGLAPYALRETYELVWQPADKIYHVTGTLLKVPAKTSGPKQSRRYDTTLPDETVKTLVETMQAVSWTPARKPAEMIEHTDDYPNLTIVFQWSPKNTVKLASTSNTALAVPWNRYEGEQIFVNADSRLGKATQQLFQHIRSAD